MKKSPCECTHCVGYLSHGTQPVDEITKIEGLLEGMDPETGSFVRDPEKLRKMREAFLKREKVDAVQQEEVNGNGASQIEKSLEQGLRAAQAENEQNADQKQSVVELKRVWSKRLISTMSNRSRADTDDDEDEQFSKSTLGKRIRFTIMILTTLCLSSILSNILTFNFTYICMAGYKQYNDTGGANSTFLLEEEEDIKDKVYNPRMDYTSAQRSALFMAVAIGALFAVFPITLGLNRYGTRAVFATMGFVSAISTLLIPGMACLGFRYIFGMRIIQGASFASCLPIMGTVTSYWSTTKQNGIFIAILSSFLQIAPIFTMPVSGALCISWLGWEFVYYLHGLVAVTLFTVFLLYHRNIPSEHPLVTQKEIYKISVNKTFTGERDKEQGSSPNDKNKRKKDARSKVPYKAMYSDRAIWAILVASFGNFMGTQLSLQFMPTYINKVLFRPVEETGLLSAISPIIMFFIKLLAGQSSDRIKFISDGVKLRIYNTLSMGAMGSLFIVLALLDPTKNPNLCLMILISSTCILGFNSGGFFKSSQMVSCQHSHFTLANISFLNCVCMLLVPLLNELIAPENAPENWAIVLWVHGLILHGTNIFFCIFASAKPATWTSKSASGGRKRGIRRSKIAPSSEATTVASTPSRLSPTMLTPPRIVIESIGN